MKHFKRTLFIILSLAPTFHYSIDSNDVLDFFSTVHKVIKKEAPRMIQSGVKEAEEAQTTKPFNWCVYENEPGKVGKWNIKPESEIDTTQKRVALLVHGHNTTSLINGFKNYAHTMLNSPIGKIGVDIVGLFSQSKKEKVEKMTSTWTEPMKPTFGLGSLIHLARFLYNDVYHLDNPNEKKYDIIVGYAYSSVGRLSNLASDFSHRAKELFKNASKVDIFAHSMGGLLSRAALEENDLLLESSKDQNPKFGNLITFGSPHMGIPARFFNIIPSEETWSTLDMFTAFDPFKERSEFLTKLNDASQPEESRKIANYFTLVGDKYDDYMTGNTEDRNPPQSNTSTTGSFIQNIFSIFIPGIITDGLIPTYSASGKACLKEKSDSYKENVEGHTKTVHLNHTRILGSSDPLNDGHVQGDQCPQCIMTEAIKPWVATL